jgi:hypothetical protein
MALNNGINLMTDEKVATTVGEKAELIVSAKDIMIHAPYPLGWQFIKSPDSFHLSIRALDKISVKGDLNGTVSIEVTTDA